MIRVVIGSGKLLAPVSLASGLAFLSLGLGFSSFRPPVSTTVGYSRLAYLLLYCSFRTVSERKGEQKHKYQDSIKGVEAQIKHKKMLNVWKLKKACGLVWKLKFLLIN
jgi:hypothetical protein